MVHAPARRRSQRSKQNAPSEQSKTYQTRDEHRPCGTPRGQRQTHKRERGEHETLTPHTSRETHGQRHSDRDRGEETRARDETTKKRTDTNKHRGERTFAGQRSRACNGATRRGAESGACVDVLHRTRRSTSGRLRHLLVAAAVLLLRLLTLLLHIRVRRWRHRVIRASRHSDG